MVKEISLGQALPPSAGAMADARVKSASNAVRPVKEVASSVDAQPVQHRVVKPKEPLVQFDPEKLQAQLDAVVERLNLMAQDAKRAVSFQPDPALGFHVIKVTNVNTGELIRTIPTDVAIRVAHNIEAFKGLLHDTKV